jgi:hypothetical protein
VASLSLVLGSFVSGLGSFGPVLGMSTAAVACWLALTAWVPGAIGREVFFGMLGPLVAVVGTWMLVDRTARVHPARLTHRMMVAFGVKVVFFAAYVAAVLAGTALRPVPFVLSFTGYFVGLYGIEAALMKRLLVRVAL